MPKSYRPVEDDIMRAQDAEYVLDNVKPPRWFNEACKVGDAERLRDNASFVSLATAQQLVERARILSVEGAYQALRSYAQSFLASFEDAKWGGRHAN
jgi:hypothetical protein